jgi:tryptophan synthase beta chain
MPRGSGRYGQFGGQYVPPSLIPVLDLLETAYVQCIKSPDFLVSLDKLLSEHVGRPTPLMPISNSERSGATIYLKREDLTNSGGNYSNSAAGQCLLARWMDLKAVVTDAGSGDQGVATASLAAKLGLVCTIYMAEADCRAQEAMVRRMAAFGADVRPVIGDGTMLHHAMSAAIQHWMGHSTTCMYVAGAPGGPHPYPAMIRHFQSVIGREARAQLWAMSEARPSAAIAALGGGSSAIGLFAGLASASVRLIVAEAGGDAANPDEHAASLSYGKIGVLHGAQTLLLRDADGQIAKGRSIASGLTYPAVGPELADLYQRGAIEAQIVFDHEALAALRRLALTEGVLISLEAAHAAVCAFKLAAELSSTEAVICAINSGGGKDMQHLAPARLS